MLSPGLVPRIVTLRRASGVRPFPIKSPGLILRLTIRLMSAFCAFAEVVLI